MAAGVASSEALSALAPPCWCHRWHYDVSQGASEPSSHDEKNLNSRFFTHCHRGLATTTPLTQAGTPGGCLAEGTGGVVGLGARFGGNAAIVRAQSQSPQSPQLKAFLAPPCSPALLSPHQTQTSSF